MTGKKQHRIDGIVPGSIAEELGLSAGDVLLTVNGSEISDVFDYHYLIHDEELVVLVRKQNGEEWELEIEKDYDEDLGIEFFNGLMDHYRSCRNKCIFCFIDQLPKGMRDTLYFKDDDSRLSFLQGNYVTLTNLSDQDLERIIAYRLAPINISVHTTDPALRVMMLNNRFAGEALKKIDRLFSAGIEMNGQIVLCRGVNDGRNLERTISDLTGYMPHMQSVSVVPVGLSKHREGLYPLEPFTKEDAKEVLAVIHKWQKICLKRAGIHFIHASDEWYLLAEEPLPQEAGYDGYLQLENGVGMLRLLLDEFDEAFLEIQKEQLSYVPHTVSIATGRLAAPILKQLSARCMEHFPGVTILIYPIRNDFFGERITVSGLLTGQDLIGQLSGKNLGEKLLLPCNLLRKGEEVLLDDVTVSDLKTALQVDIDIVKSSGQDLLYRMLQIEREEEKYE